MNQDLVYRNADWFRETGQMPDAELPSIRQSAFYCGMQCEELAEKLGVIFGEQHPTVTQLETLGRALKAGELDKWVETAFQNPQSVHDMLDGDIDLLFVSVGAAKAQGADAGGAYGSVIGANEGKRFPDGTYHRAPVTGKVQKPEGWQPPNLWEFMHHQFQRRNKA